MSLFNSACLRLPIGLLLVGLLVPAILALAAPQFIDVFEGLPHWLSSWIYLALSWLAVRLTCKQLLESSLPADECPNGPAGLQAHTRTAELLIMGTALLSLSWGSGPEYIEEAMLFVSMRLGITLLLLGGMVLVFTHIKMRGLQE
ncbi:MULTISPECIES: hypothetical protein [Cellvibrio]|jgi:hypothetical protein|uniref:Uncharacterized protein n=1 Tax=Cellvibrio fibrivorans TaxID=126350 RepID=A0ABU1UVN3_9GAMM|nr:hypothetical protein [Cellvibrio fibrivorans]MDR7089173.1 hypothetical protein [Cellvibrio fibrivorans]